MGCDLNKFTRTTSEDDQSLYHSAASPETIGHRRLYVFSGGFTTCTAAKNLIATCLRCKAC